MRRSPGRLLDIGAGSGTFVHASLDAGWQAVGVELSEPAIERAKEYYGIELLKSLPDEEFDVITMWDVVEHLRDPAAVLQELHGRLRRDGLLLMETGNYENWLRVLEGERWSLYLLDHHFYFSPASLSSVVSRGGFSDFGVLDVAHFAPSLRRTLQQPRWGLRAWQTYFASKRAWPRHGDINVMVAVATA